MMTDHLYEARLVRKMLAKHAPLQITDADGNSVVISLPTFDWLIDEVERLRRLCVDYSRRLGDAEHDASLMLAALRERDETRREVKRLRGRLRGRLREIEWTTDGSSGPPDFIPICPACRGYKGHGHRKDCWLAAEI